jgi:hypothetical protein
MQPLKAQSHQIQNRMTSLSNDKIKQKGGYHPPILSHVWGLKQHGMKSKTLVTMLYKDNESELKTEDLAQFKPWTKTLHQTPLGIQYTNGVRYVADHGRASWLIDLIATEHPPLRNSPFQIWRLTAKQGKVLLRCEDSDEKELYSKEIENTSFPLPELTLYFTDFVLMLSTEF